MIKNNSVTQFFKYIILNRIKGNAYTSKESIVEYLVFDFKLNYQINNYLSASEYMECKHLSLHEDWDTFCKVNNVLNAIRLLFSIFYFRPIQTLKKIQHRFQEKKSYFFILQ